MCALFMYLLAVHMLVATWQLREVYAESNNKVYAKISSMPRVFQAKAPFQLVVRKAPKQSAKPSKRKASLPLELEQVGFALIIRVTGS